MFKKIKAAGKKTVAIEEHKSSLEPANEKDPRARLETEEERKERKSRERDGKGEFCLFRFVYFVCVVVVAVVDRCKILKKLVRWWW